MSKYVIDVDYGTPSARSVLADTADGGVIVSREYVYPHAVMNEKNISGAEPSAATAQNTFGFTKCALSLPRPSQKAIL